jgi:hypothetical protein
VNAIVQHFHFSPGTLIAYDGYEVVVSGPVKGGIAVRDRFVGENEAQRYFVLDDQMVQKLLQRTDAVIDDNFDTDSSDISENLNSPSRFEDRSEAERHTAFQREAWCKATHSTLQGGPYTETRIKYKFAQIQSHAIDLQRINALGIKSKNGKFEGRTWGAKSVSNFCKTYYAQKNPHPRALLSDTPSGNTRRRLSAAEDCLLETCCRAYLSKAQPAKASIVRLVERRFREVRNERLRAGNTAPFLTPHSNTVYRRLDRFNRLELVFSREGRQAAQKEFSPTQHGVRALKPGELIELDFWKGDVFTFSKRSEFWDLLTPDLQKVLKDGKKDGPKSQRQRLWICVALDVATRMPLGIGIAETPNPRTVIELLDQIMREKIEMSTLAGCSTPWSQHSGIGTIIVDTGAEFFDNEVRTAILATGGSFVYGRAAVPMDKPFVERLFGGFRTLFADELPGKTGYSPQCLVAYDKAGMAAFNTEQFRHLILRYLVDHYPLRKHTGLLGKRPIDAWKDSQKYGAVRPPTLRVRRKATGLKLKRMLSKEGIKICGIPFSSPSLFPHALRNGKIKVEVFVDPQNLREVTIHVEDQIFYLANQRPDLEHHSIRTLMAAIKKMTATKPSDRTYYEYVLAKHADWFAEQIRAGIQARGLPSQEATAQEIDWFESTFCLRLQIEKNPEQAQSADIATLLQGGTGPGIFSPADIAAEKASATAEPVVEVDQEADPPPQPKLIGAVDITGSNDASVEGPTVQSRTRKRKDTSSTGPFVGKPKGKGKFI